MSTMNIQVTLSEGRRESPAVKPFLLYREAVAPELEKNRAALDRMYAPVMGRPEIEPVFLMGLTLLQLMERLPDRQAVNACLYDVRWRMALNIPPDWQGLDPSTLVYFRKRLAQHQQAKLALEAALNAMRKTGYLKKHGAVRIDSTHMLADIAAMSRLECVRETLRMSLEFLVHFGGASAWEPWRSRYAERHPKELRDPPVERLKTTMKTAGIDCAAVLAKAEKLGSAVSEAEPIRLLRRVFGEQFEPAEPATQLRAALSGAVQNPHDPDASWSTKRSLGKTGWIGYKLQVCETAPEVERSKGEPTEAVITAVVTQPAITSDHGSIAPVMSQHEHNGQNPPGTVYTDAGYISATQLAKAEESGLEICGPMPAPPHSAHRFGSDDFTVDLPNRSALCPGEKTSSACSFITERTLNLSYYYFEWALADCSECPLKGQCVSTRKNGGFRTLQVSQDHMIAQARRQLGRTPEYRLRMRKRNGIEGTISELKRGYGARRARYRGRIKTDGQLQFMAAACNLRRWSARLCWLTRQNRAKAA